MHIDPFWPGDTDLGQHWLGPDTGLKISSSLIAKCYKKWRKATDYPIYHSPPGYHFSAILVQFLSGLQDFGKGCHIENSISLSCYQEHLTNFKACWQHPAITWIDVDLSVIISKVQTWHLFEGNITRYLSLQSLKLTWNLRISTIS